MLDVFRSHERTPPSQRGVARLDGPQRTAPTKAHLTAGGPFFVWTKQIPETRKRKTLLSIAKSQTRVAGAGGARSPTKGRSKAFRTRLVTKVKREDRSFKPNNRIAQLVEHDAEDVAVAGSTPAPKPDWKHRSAGERSRSPLAPR